MEDSILRSTKEILGLDPDSTAFDTDVITHINTALSDLTDIGIGPSAGFAISGSSETWQDYIGTNIRYNAVKTFVWLKTRTFFDPPEGRYAIQATDGQLNQMLWRLNVIRENTAWVDPDPEVEDDEVLFGGT